MNISVTDLKNGNFLATMRFAYCADREQFVSAFKSIGLPVTNESDLVVLNDLHEKGLDVSGKMKNMNGEVVVQNLKDFVNQIQLRHNQLYNCNLKFVA